MNSTNLTAGIVSAAILLGAGSINTAAHSDNAASSVPSAVSPGAPMDTYESFQVRRVLRLSGYDTANALHITLPPPAQTRQSASADRNGPLQVAFDRDMPAEYESNLSSRMEWVPLKDGIVAGQALVTSPGATNMRMGVSVDLPPEAEIRFFGTDSTQTYSVVTREDISWKGSEPHTLWSPVVDGETIGIEIVLPSRKSTSTFSFEIDEILHGYMESGGFGTVPQLCSNQVDAMCRISRLHTDAPYANVIIGSVAKITYRADGGGGFECSGTMMNDRVDGNFIPYFLTANHCISSRTEARSIVAQWYYLRAACGRNAPRHSRYFTTSFGAKSIGYESQTGCDVPRLQIQSKKPTRIFRIEV